MYVLKKGINFSCRLTKRKPHFYFHCLPWKFKNTVLSQSKTYSVLFLYSFGQSTMRKEKELLQVTFWTYIYTLALFCSLFFSLYSSSFILSTCRDDDNKREKEGLLKQIFRFFFFLFTFIVFEQYPLEYT